MAMLAVLFAERLIGPPPEQPAVPGIAFGIVGGALVVLFALGAAMTKELPAPGPVPQSGTDSPARILGSSLLSLGVFIVASTSWGAPELYSWVVVGLIAFGAGALLLVLSARNH